LFYEAFSIQCIKKGQNLEDAPLSAYLSERMFVRKRVLWVFLGLLACDTSVEQLFVDPPIQLADGYAIAAVEGDPYVELGYYEEQLYRPLQVGGDCPVGYGLQGGTWTMPAVRTQGIGSPATIACDLVTSGGEQLGKVAAKQQFYLATDGFLEIAFFPLPVTHEPPFEEQDISDLYGQEATIRCTVTDGEGRTESAVVQVVISEA